MALAPLCPALPVLEVARLCVSPPGGGKRSSPQEGGRAALLMVVSLVPGAEQVFNKCLPYLSGLNSGLTRLLQRQIHRRWEVRRGEEGRVSHRLLEWGVPGPSLRPHFLVSVTPLPYVHPPGAGVQLVQPALPQGYWGRSGGDGEEGESRG